MRMGKHANIYLSGTVTYNVYLAVGGVETMVMTSAVPPGESYQPVPRLHRLALDVRKSLGISEGGPLLSFFADSDLPVIDECDDVYAFVEVLNRVVPMVRAGEVDKVGRNTVSDELRTKLESLESALSKERPFGFLVGGQRRIAELFYDRTKPKSDFYNASLRGICADCDD